MDEPKAEIAVDQRSNRLMSAGFVGLLGTQLFTAVNDNVFRWLVIGIGKDYVENIGFVLMAGTIVFVAPYLLLAAPAGYLADRYPKWKVIVGCKIAEIFIMALGVIGIVVGSLNLLLVVVGLTGAQSALFSPAKLGAIPESLKPEKISSANGLFGLVTVAATVVGMGVGGRLKDLTGYRGQENVWISAAVVIGIAVVGMLFSFLVRRQPAANPARLIPWNAIGQTVGDLKLLASHRPMLRVALGMVFFWSLGATAQLNIDQFSMESGGLLESDRTPLLFSLVAGVGVGSILAGIWSAGRVELGIIPLGAFGVALTSLLLFTVDRDIMSPEMALSAGLTWACILLFLLGTSSGLFHIPLEAFMQHRSDPQRRGSILAAANFMVFAGVMIAAGVFYLLRLPIRGDEPLMSSRQIFLLFGLGTLPVFVYVIWLIPQASIRFLVWLASRTIYRIRVYGGENLPERGGALLVANHVSWLDGVLLLLTSSRPVRIIVWAANFEGPVLRRLANQWGAIPVSTSPKSIARAIKTAREALAGGELVCIFPEGGITRTGQVQSFKPGLLKINKGIGAPVVPVYLDGLWGSIFSFEGGKFFWKWPRRWPYPISIYFGLPIEPPPEEVHAVRQAVLELGATAVQQRSERVGQTPAALIKCCKIRKRSMKIADSTGAQLSGGAILTRSLVLRRLLRRHVLSGDEKYVGVLLPPTVPGVVVNAALALDSRVAVNLNYTVSSGIMNKCLATCGIRHVLTSRKFMEKMNFDIDAEFVYLEDYKDKPTLADKLLSAAAAHAVPARMLARHLGVDRQRPDDILTVIFTSGSTGDPKGVMLTNANVFSNIQAIDQVVNLNPSDVVVGILPFFHSFGFTITLWTVLSLDVQGIYHFSPLEPRQIGKLTQQHKGTILLATPTFLRSMLKRVEKEQFQTLDVVVAGAEKLPSDLCDEFEQKFGVRPVEGYGATELSPLVSVNIPPSRSFDRGAPDSREGTVGRPVPGVTVKVVDPDTGEALGPGQPGMLLVKGPNVMKGYFGRDDLTAKALRDGWYVTGDIAFVDEDGFIKITGRLSRFSKIGGEMVPHIEVEELLNEIVGGDAEGRQRTAITAVPDPRKGERLIVVHTGLDKDIDELRRKLQERLPNIYVPGADGFMQVQELPVLGSGKLDLKQLKQIALAHFGAADAHSE